MTTPIRPLRDVLAEIPDPRHKRGVRYPLGAVLSLACVAMLCGYKSYSAMAEWDKNYGDEIITALGFTRKTVPCAATFCQIFRRLDRKAVEATLGRWAEAVLAATTPAQSGPEVLACDGKTLRGSRHQGAPGAHLLSAVSHRLGITMQQEAVATKKSEQGALTTLLKGLILEGRVLTMDALHTNRQTAQNILEHKGNYVMIVKKNQPTLREDIRTLFAQPEMVRDTFRTAQTIDSGHGRVETRRLTASTALNAFSSWPGVQQVFQIERTVIVKKTGEQHTEVVEGVTSLSPEQASAADLLRYVRQHWHIETKSHWIRDVTFDEDRSQVRVGSIPEVMAVLRCTVLSLLRASGTPNVATATRHYAAQAAEALALIAQPLTFK